MEVKEELWLSGWQLPHTTTKGRVRVTSSNPPGKRHRPAFGVTVPNPLQARAAYVALKVKDPGCGCLSSPAAGCPASGCGLPACSAQPEAPALPQRSPGARGHRSGDAKRVAEEGGGPGGDTHPPKQAAGGEGGGRERSGRRCRCRCCWPPASSPLFGFDRPRHS